MLPILSPSTPKLAKYTKHNTKRCGLSQCGGERAEQRRRLQTHRRDSSVTKSVGARYPASSDTQYLTTALELNLEPTQRERPFIDYLL